MWTITKGEIQKNVLNGNVLITFIVSFVLLMTSFCLLHGNGLGFLSKAGQPVMSASEKVNPLFSEFQSPDIMYFVMVVLSLLVIAFSYDAISGEHQDGTLKLMLANAVPRDAVILAKWLGTFLNIAVPFILAMSSVTVSASFFQMIDLKTIALTTLASLIYLSVYVGVALFVSVVTKTPKTSALLGLLLWIVFIFILPSSAKLVAESLVKPPSIQRVEWQNTVIWGIFDFRLHNEERFDFKAASEDWNTEVENARTHKQNKERQLLLLTRSLSRVSPSASFGFLMTGLVKAASAQKTPLEPKDNVEAPGYRIETFHLSSVDILIEFAVLTLFSILFFLLTYFLFLRYDLVT